MLALAVLEGDADDDGLSEPLSDADAETDADGLWDADGLRLGWPSSTFEMSCAMIVTSSSFGFTRCPMTM